MRVVGLGCILGLLFTGVALAEGPYVGGQLGMTFVSDSDVNGFWAPDRDGVYHPVALTTKFDKGLGLGVVAGYDFGQLRLEGELGYQRNDIDQVSVGPHVANASGHLTCSTFLVNGYYDFHNSTPFTPFVNAGVGIATVEMKDFAIMGASLGSDRDTVFAYQLGMGVGYAVNKNVTVDLKYRYLAATDPKFGAGIDSEFASHNIYLGLRYSF